LIVTRERDTFAAADVFAIANRHHYDLGLSACAPRNPEGLLE